MKNKKFRTSYRQFCAVRCSFGSTLTFEWTWTRQFVDGPVLFLKIYANDNTNA